MANGNTGPDQDGSAGPNSAAEALRQAYARAGRPWSAHLDLTYRCDLDCQHCYLDDRKTWPELTTAEWLNTLDQLAEIGVLQLSWSGGELLLRKDLGKLLDRARTLGFVCSLRSHLGLLTPAIAREWRDAGIEKVRTSVYSLDPARHDAFTRRPGSLRATLAGLQLLVEAGVDAGADVVVQAETTEEIPKMVAFFAARGIKVEFSTSIYRDHRAEPHLDLLDLTSEQRVRARELIFTHHKPFADVHAPASAQPEEGPCGAGRSYFYIAPDGAVWPCVMFPMSIGHLREHSLQEIWDFSPERQALAQW
jgi:MoaA/NifB/PqqE/SkfB family radical SAM enzyme